MVPPTTRAAGALLQTASALSNVHRHHAMTSEALLLALLCDPLLTDPMAAIAEEPELRRVVLESDERPNKVGWSERAFTAYTAAWKRASARERQRAIGERARSVWGAMTSGNRLVPMVLALSGTLSVGDIIHGLSGEGGLSAEILRQRSIDPARFDGEAPSPEVSYPAALAEDSVVDVVCINDDVTPMPFVVELLERHFGLDALRATYCMYRVHACGRARIATCTRRLAEQRIDAALEEARGAKLPLAFVYGARIT
jgi:ATP-dependent Clp protease adapter protein ClpS